MQGFEIDGWIATPENTEVWIHFDKPLATHIEIDTGAQFPMAYVMESDEDITQLVELEFPIVPVQHTTQDMIELIARIRTSRLDEEIRHFQKDNPVT